MGRHLFRISAAFSVVLCVVTIAAWVGSYWHSWQVPHYLGSDGYSISSWGGRVFIQHVRVHSRAQPFVIALRVPGLIEDDRESDPEYWRSISKFHLDVMGLWKAEFPRASLGNAFGFGYHHVSDPYESMDTLSIPYWSLAAVSLLLPIAWSRRAARRVPGRCRVCGYDLRATPNRCPECGNVPTSGPAAE